MFTNNINHIKNILDRALLQWKNVNQNLKIKKQLRKEEYRYLDSYQIKSIDEYWKPYTKKYNINFFNYYSYRTKKFSKLYIPDNLYYSYIDMHFNNSKYSPGIDNKNYYDKLFPTLKQPQTLLRRMNGYYYNENYELIEPKGIEKLINSDNNVLKPSVDTQGGEGVTFFNTQDIDIMEEVMSKTDNFIIQKEIKQHESLVALHPNSLNTIRVVSLLFKGEVHILSSVLRVGVSGSKVDNASSGGVVVGIKDGKLRKYAYAISEGTRYTKHPDTNMYFKGHVIPNFEKILNIVKREAKRFPYFRLISWDFAVNDEGDIIFIEFNLKNGQLDFHQLTNGPLFGELTDEVLTEVFRKG